MSADAPAAVLLSVIGIPTGDSVRAHARKRLEETLEPYTTTANGCNVVRIGDLPEVIRSTIGTGVPSELFHQFRSPVCPVTNDCDDTTGVSLGPAALADIAPP